LKEFGTILGFGSSDCNCEGYLFFGNGTELVKYLAKKGMRELHVGEGF
jgi:Uri superfamily endonuclease